MEHVANDDIEKNGLLEPNTKRSDAKELDPGKTEAIMAYVIGIGGVLVIGCALFLSPIDALVDWFHAQKAAGVQLASEHPVGFVLGVAAVLLGGGALLAIVICLLVGKRKPSPTNNGWLAAVASVASSLASTGFGLFSIWLYFADLVTDIQVATLLWSTRNFIWASEATFFLILQYTLVYRSVLKYLQATMGTNYNGESVPLPLWVMLATVPGVLALDALMLLEPLGVLKLLPKTKRDPRTAHFKNKYRGELISWIDWDELRAFLPSYRATRVPTEVVAEAAPQTALQSYIYVRTQTGANTQLAEYATLLPVSICLSALSLLKTWGEVLYGAQKAGCNLVEWVEQMLRMGGGLQLDAIRKSTIDTLVSPHYDLEFTQVELLADALMQNASLMSISLESCGLGGKALERLASPILSIATLTELKYAACLNPGARSTTVSSR